MARKGASPPSEATIDALAADVVRVTRAEKDEAHRFARIAITASADLAREYRLVWPPLLHNSLVNAGARERGLCYQFADDLAGRLEEAGPWSFQMRPVVARENSYWRVHHGIAIGHPEMELNQWLVLDPWRHSGRLFWSMIGEDEVPWIRWTEPKKSS